MSLFTRSQRRDVPPIPTPADAGRFNVGGAVRVNRDTAMRASAVWACLRLRADLISTMPVDLYRKVNGVGVEVPKPPVLINPDGRSRIGIMEWLYSSQVDLDRAGNSFGLITEVNALGLPARIELVALDEVSVFRREGELGYRFGGDEYTGANAAKVWHERQFTLAGLDVGLSPVAYSAFSVGAYLSAQAFALDWFGNDAMPAATLKNTQKVITAKAAEQIKARAQAHMRPGGLFVHGADWELKPVNGASAQNQYVELMQFGVPDISRFFGCPADLIDGAVAGSSLTYANIGQRNMQLLIMNLGPAVTRREAALSTLTPAPRYVKLNRGALLAMDPATRATTIKTRIDSRTLALDEARALDDLPPLTPEQIAQFDAVFGAARTTPTEVAK